MAWAPTCGPTRGQRPPAALPAPTRVGLLIKTGRAAKVGGRRRRLSMVRAPKAEAAPALRLAEDARLNPISVRKITAIISRGPLGDPVSRAMLCDSRLIQVAEDIFPTEVALAFSMCSE